MQLALALARRAEGRTAPNPPVGAVVVNGGRIVGAGFHRQAGAPHAETIALRRAGARARGSTLYVTLEPCNHHGRTPPCCDAILSSGVARVVVGATDPNPITNGRGIARLRRRGLEVGTGVLVREVDELIRPFRKAVRTGLPFVTAKIGQSLDGKIATVTGASRWITSPAARRVVHQWRARADAILVGVNTVLRDDPLLSARGRGAPARHPVKVIVDSRLRTPPAARCLSAHSPAPTIIATTDRAAQARRSALGRRGAEVLTLPARRGRVAMGRLCRTLVQRGVHSILIEGGGEVLAGAFAERLVDRIAFFIAPIIVGGRRAPGPVGGEGVQGLSHAIRLANWSVRRVGGDLCVEAKVVYPKTATRGTRPVTRPADR